jgi:hypothetical protein
MSFPRPIKWFHSHADPIWPDGTFNKSAKLLSFEGIRKRAECLLYCTTAQYILIITFSSPSFHSFQHFKIKIKKSKT